MSRENCIETIEALYPPDSDDTQTAEIGREIMLRALAETWRELPENVLMQMGWMCAQKERE